MESPDDLYNQTSRSSRRSASARSVGANGGGKGSRGNDDEIMTDSGRERDTLIKRFLTRNSKNIEALDPTLAGLPIPHQVLKMQGTLDGQYGGDFVRYYNDLQADERDLRMRTSYQVN